MKKSVLVLLLLATSLFAQEKKYQGLLWEVSGNGLKKSSYLYGSMHVSDKVSYHLSDAFFTHLLAADIIANESEPSTWTDLIGMVGGKGNSYGNNKLYAGFYLQPAARNDLFPLFRSNNYTINNLLFRTNEYQKEYQEETYLDMFIYRTGRKYNKKTVGLEDTKTSLLNIMNIDARTMKPREENIAALQKILKNTGYEEALMNYYRDKDLDMLDSLTSLASSPAYLKTLLYDRNIVMAHSIDSLVKTGSLFAAVGAAHLPGKRGLIEMLRFRGYTVKPVTDRYTDAGKAKKQAVEDYFLKPIFTQYTTTDGMVSLPMFKGSVIETQENVQSPDLANGGYINIKRLLLKDYLNKNNKPFNHQSLDSLFYENIPGRIVEKNFSQPNGIYQYDIKSITKTGNTQRYRYYITPLEVIAISMAGEKNYVRQFEAEVFNNIKIKNDNTGWTTVTPTKGGFSVNMPNYLVIHGQNKTAKVITDPEYYAYDATDKANYFVLERTTDDLENLEDTNFELKRMHYEFYNQLGIDSTQTQLTANPAAFTSAAKIGDKSIRLKSVINGAKYYLLGVVGATEANSNNFFKLFALTPFKEDVAYQTYKDTTALYSISIPKAENAKLEFDINLPELYGRNNDDGNVFKEKYGTKLFTLPSGQPLEVFHHKYHRYHAVEADSLWADLKKYITEQDVDTGDDVPMAPTPEMARAVVAQAWEEDVDYQYAYDSQWDRLTSTKDGKITLRNEKTENKGDYQTFEATVVKTNSTQSIKFKAFYRNGTSYMISTLVNKDYKNDDAAVEKMFASFTLLDNSKEEKLPANRLQLFIDDAHSEYDSIRNSALASVVQLQITKENHAALEGFIDTFTFKPDETETLIRLYDMLGGLKDDSVIPFFERQYKQQNSNTIIQFAVLEALTDVETPAAYKKIKELMEFDLPVSDKDYEVSGLFNRFRSDTKNSAILFPDIFEYFSVPEYHEPIVAFTATLLEDDAIRPKKLKSYKKMLVTNTRLEIKRAKSRRAGKESGEDDYAYTNNTSGNLPDYMELLYPFKNDKNVSAVFAAVKALDSKDTNMETVRLDVKNNNINTQEINALLNNPQTLFEAQKMLTAQKKTALLKNVTDEQIALSAMLTMVKVDTETDSVTLNETRVVNQGNNSITFYFFKIKTAKEGDEYSYRQGRERLAAIAFVNKGSRINPQAYKNVGTKTIADKEELEDYKNAMVDATLNASKIRATFGKKGSPYNDGEYDDDYEDGDY